MITLLFGLKKPETGDKGDVVFPAMEENLEQLDAHTHDGITSAKVTSSSISPLSESIAAGLWVGPDSGGLFKQTITLPVTLEYDTTAFTVRLSSTGEVVYPKIEKVSGTQYDIYTNDNSVGFVVTYL